MAGGLAVVAATSVVAWALGAPQNSLGATAVRAVADCAGAVVLGLSVMAFLDTGRHRAELVRSAAPALAVGAAVWLLAEVVRLLVVTAQAAALPVGGVGVGMFIDFVVHTNPGRAGLVSAVAAAAVCATAVAAPPTAASAYVTGGIAAAGLTARTLAGHLTESALGGVSVAVHTLAAGLWCGTLAGLLLTVRHRGQWARVLPRFSTLALGCVALLAVLGVAGTFARLDSPAQLWDTGYGRVLTAKLIVTAALLVLAWRNRTGWLPAARGHRATAGLSRTRSLAELAIMAAALTLAAALAVTG
ncbi:copper resistance protein CopD [Mycobacterium sp. PS03-16]|nr:copper resistance protein CopD [Mycobacterium sp. PS03-16]